MPTCEQMRLFLDRQRVLLDLAEERITIDQAKQRLAEYGFSPSGVDSMIHSALWLRYNRARGKHHDQRPG